MAAELTLRPATLEDHDAVRTLCERVWPERDIEYLPEVYPEWLRGEDRRTLAAESAGRLVGIAQCVLLSDREAWLQGLRVDPGLAGRGIGSDLIDALFAWARGHGAIVARNMVFSWNAAGMGHSRAMGFEPVTSFRWAYPEPADREPPIELRRSGAAAWQTWVDSDARSWLHGLSADRRESWALSECREQDVRAVALDDGALAVVHDGLAGMAMRGRRYDPRDGQRGEYGIEYAAAAWIDATSARTLVEAVSADAHVEGASEARMLVPETPRHVSDVAWAGVDIDEAPHLIFGVDLLRGED